MRIGIDARELCGRPTGVGRYLNGLLAEWAVDNGARRHEFVLYAPEPLTVTLDARRFATRIVPGPGGTWWEQVRLPAVAAKDHLDVLFAPAYTAPLLRTVATVVAIHDLSFAAHPEWFGVREGIRRRWLSRQSAERARAVITISQFSRRELTEKFGLHESKIHVIPPGITPPAVTTAAADGHGSVLYVGSIFNRRHVPDLIRAFGPIARRHPLTSLEIVGDNRSVPREDLRTFIAVEGLTGSVRWREWVADRELGALYGSARAFGFLSEYEGFGLTPLEALAAGVPSVLLDTAVARETCGEAALFVRCGDIAATTRALEQLLFDQATRARILEAAPSVLARYSWPRAARETLAVIEGCT
jgi:glycosyltransferase involved in cell wall biosynthesis